MHRRQLVMPTAVSPPHVAGVPAICSRKLLWKRACPTHLILVLQAVLDACRPRGWCALALQLLTAVEALGRAPTVEQIDGVLAACAAGGAVQEVGGVGGSWERVADSLLAPVCR